MDNVRAILMICVITYEAWTRRAACQVEGMPRPHQPVDVDDECATKVSSILSLSRTTIGSELLQTMLVGIRNTHSLVGAGAGEGSSDGFAGGLGLGQCMRQGQQL